MIKEKCRKCGKNIGWIVLGMNAFLVIVKGLFAYISRSQSLLADGFESMANLIVTIIVIISLRISEREHTERHPYGYGKIEFLASGAVNFILLLVAIFFVVVSLKEMLVIGIEKPPEMIAIYAALISIIVNQVAYLYGKCAGEKLRSPMILANAYVNRIDVATSLAVIIAVVGANLGIGFLDHLVAIVIAVLIIKTTAEGMGKAIMGLLDYSSKHEISRIKTLAMKVVGVVGVKNLRARQVGRTVWIDMEILISNKLKLKDGIDIIKRIKQALHESMKNIAEISIQMAPVETGAGEYGE